MKIFGFALLLFTAQAHAYDLRVLAGLDTFLSTGTGFSSLENAELGINARIEAKNIKKLLDVKLDFSGREAFIGNSTMNHLWELKLTLRNLAGRVDLTIGRFRTPGGFWLIADGALLTLKYTPWLSQSAWGGLRSFSTGRRDTWMASSPLALPLAGTSLQVSHHKVTAQVSFTWSRDAVDQPIQGADTGPPRERQISDEYFLDGFVSVIAHPKVWMSAGASLGTRYDVKLDATNPYGPTSLGVVTLGAVGTYGVIEYRPHKRVRLVYNVQYERVRLIQSQLLTLKPDGTPVQTADGSFVDQSLRIVWLAWRALRLEGTYRPRFRATTDIEHHVLVGVRADDLWKGLGAYVSAGVDLNRFNAGQPNTHVHNRVIYNAGLSFTKPWLDLRGGILFTDGIGSGLLFSASQVSGGATPSELNPFILESSRVAYVRVFAMFWKMYAGVDVEENIDAAQLRALVQVGASL